MSVGQSRLEQVAERNLVLRTLADLPVVLRKLWSEFRRQGPLAATQYSIDHITRLVRGAPPPHYSRVTPNLHVGGQYTQRGLARLQARGVTAVVNMRDEFDNAAAGLAPPAYLYLPTVDDTPPRLVDLCRGIAFIQQEIAAGGQVYVHCMLGLGRSVTLVAAFLVSQGNSPPEAWRTIRRARPFIQPTPEQVALIEEFERIHSECASLTASSKEN